MNPNIITESVQQFNLKWTNYTTNLLEVMVDKFSKGFLTDVTLCCDGTLIRAHKMVLAACSTFFEVRTCKIMVRRFVDIFRSVCLRFTPNPIHSSF